MTKVIALTGNIATGKTTVGGLLQKRGIPVLDSDDIVHAIYQDDERVKQAIIKEFGSLDRKLIAQQIFGDSVEAKTRRKLLEAIIHPAVDSRFREWVKTNNHHPILVNLVPLVFEAGLESRYDYIITVRAPEELQLARLQKRNAELSLEQMTLRIKSQLDQDTKAKKSDFVIENSGNIDDLEMQLDEILAEIGP